MYQSTDFIKIKIPVSHMLFYWHKNITQKQQMGWIKKKREGVPYCRTNNLCKPQQEGIAWKCTGWLWHATLGHSITVRHENRCPSVSESSFMRKEAMSSTSSIIIGKRRHCLLVSPELLKIKGFLQIYQHSLQGFKDRLPF